MDQAAPGQSVAPRHAGRPGDPAAPDGAASLMAALARPPAPGADCPVERMVAMLGGKWRLMVLFRLMGGPVRFNALARRLSPISPRILAATLRDLEAEGLVWRRSEATVPPHVSYGLTADGEALAPVFDTLARWWLARRA